MRIIGCDLHARQQTIAMLDMETGELVEKTLEHQGDELRKFYSALPGPVQVGIEATEVFLGDPKRFADGKAVASSMGMIPSEHSSGGRQRLGAMSKQGNALLRYLWCEAAMHAVRRDPEVQRFYGRKLVEKGLGKARVAAARKLGIRLWVMLRDEIDYQEFSRRGELRQKCGGAHAGMLA
jgi:transposase